MIEPIRVLRVIARMNAGGPAYHVSLLSGRLDPGTYSTLLVAGEVGPGEASMEALADRYGARLVKVNSLGPSLSPIADVRALRELVRIVRAHRPHIVHTHTAKAGLLGRLAAGAIRPRPVVVHTYHGHVLEGYFGPLKTALFRRLERRMARMSDCLLGVSQATVDDLVRLGVAPPGRFRVLPLGLELDSVANPEPGQRERFRSSVGVSGSALVITYVGRLVPIKRLDVALKAVAQARGRGIDCCLVVVGDGQCRGRLTALARSLGMEKSAIFTGYRSDIAEIVAGTDIAILTSDNEGTPVWLIEAAAAGRPAVAPAVGGVPEVVLGETGLLVPRGDVAALSDSIEVLARNPEMRTAMGEWAARHVRGRFAADRLLADVDALYRELLSRRTPTG